MATTFGLYYADITCGRFHAERFGRLRVSFVLKSYSAPYGSSIGILRHRIACKPPKLQHEITQIIILYNLLLHGLVFCRINHLCQRAQ